MSTAETTFQYDSGPPVESGRLATWLFLAAESLFFGGLLSAWLVLRAQAQDTWSAGLHPSLGVGMLMTALLVAASVAGHGAVAARARGTSGTRRLLLASALVAVFLVTQALEYRHLHDEGVSPATSLRWGSFYALTLAHGFHVLVGLLWLLWLAATGAGRVSVAPARGALEYGVLYLHFVDAVWFVLLGLLYVLR